jgi:hypothetical protein
MSTTHENTVWCVVCGVVRVVWCGARGVVCGVVRGVVRGVVWCVWCGAWCGVVCVVWCAWCGVLYHTVR